MKDLREQELLNQLRVRGKMELGEVVELLQVSESTARRLFSKLEEEGKLIFLKGLQCFSRSRILYLPK